MILFRFLQQTSTFFQRLIVKKYKNCFELLLEPCFKGQTAPLEIKIYWIQGQLIELIKTEFFEDIYATKNSPY